MKITSFGMPSAQPQSTLTKLSMHKIVILDNATLGRLSRDFCSRAVASQAKAVEFIQRLKLGGIYVGLTTTGLMELFAHADEKVVRGRYELLEQLPCVAWIRPYDGSWFVGDFTHVLLRELHEAVHGVRRPPHEVIDIVRENVWETGTGSDMFGDMQQRQVWEFFQRHTQPMQRRQVQVASLVRSEPTGIEKIRLRDLDASHFEFGEGCQAAIDKLIPLRAKEIRDHGDEKISGSELLASRQFYQSLTPMLRKFSGGNLIDSVCNEHSIPRTLVTDSMTVDELTTLVKFSLQIKSFGMRLKPPTALTLSDVEISQLPIMKFEHRISEAQRKADRYRGSDFSDSRQAALSLYADAVEVDRRTYNYVRQISRNDPLLSLTASRIIKSTEYSKLNL
jgi:hypothetical protein